MKVRDLIAYLETFDREVLLERVDDSGLPGEPLIIEGVEA